MDKGKVIITLTFNLLVLPFTPRQGDGQGQREQCHHFPRRSSLSPPVSIQGQATSPSVIRNF